MPLALNRLTRKKDFDSLYKHGKTSGDYNFSLRIASNQLTSSRLAAIVSLKVSKKAVLRNKLKRRIRNIVYALSSDLRGSYDMLVIARPAALSKNFSELKASIIKNFNQAGVLIKK